MPLTRITAEQFQQIAMAGKAMDDQTIVVKADAGLIKAVEGGRRVTFKLSSGAVDRDRDVITQAGWRLDSYMKNPVVLWGHQYGMPPIATCKGLTLADGDLTGDAEFFDRDTYEWSDTIYRIVQAGGLRACSVGFKPIKYNYNAERNGMDILEQELMEWSIVSVPANPEALVQLTASLEQGDQLLKDFVKGCERVLDTYYGCDGLWMPRAQVEKAFEVINKSGLLPVKTVVPAAVIAETAAVVLETEPVKCTEEPFLEIADDVTVLELSEEYCDVGPEQIQSIVLSLMQASIKSVVETVQSQTQAAIDYQLGRVS